MRKFKIFFRTLANPFTFLMDFYQSFMKKTSLNIAQSLYLNANIFYHNDNTLNIKHLKEHFIILKPYSSF